jgi:uncharacterized damage-inducible protein DinB
VPNTQEEESCVSTWDINAGRDMDPVIAATWNALSFGEPRLRDLIKELTPEQLTARPAQFKNSIASLVLHAAGTNVSFAHFLKGEPVAEDLKAEYLLNLPQNPIPQPEGETAASLTAKWEKAWQILHDALAGLTAADLDRELTHPKGQKFTVRWLLSLLPYHQTLHYGHMQMIRQHLA